MADVLIFGCGLIGTSVGLALSQSRQTVLLHDESAASLAVAVSRGAGTAWDGRSTAAVVLVAVPPAATGTVLAEAQRLSLGQTYTHVSSVQSVVQADVERLNCDLSFIVGGHPLAGREQSGPEAAEAGLFAGRPWAVCAGPEAAPTAVEAVRELALACGGIPVEVDQALHDRSVALLSHLPQVAASALAGLLAQPGGGASAVRYDLSGPGLVDSTRLAAGDPQLWTQILTANAEHVSPVVRALAGQLIALAEQLEQLDQAQPESALAPARDFISSFLERGKAGRERVPVKRGRGSVDFSTVAVDVDDQPGRLASLLADAGAAGINVEDVHVEHVPGRPRGVIELLVRAESAADLSAALVAARWDVRTMDLSTSR